MLHSMALDCLFMWIDCTSVHEDSTIDYSCDAFLHFITAMHLQPELIHCRGIKKHKWY